MSTLKNMIDNHLSPEAKAELEAAFSNIEQLTSVVAINLTSEERRRYGSISEQNKLFVNKVRDYFHSQPLLKTPDVDWQEFDKDCESRNILETYIARLENLITGLKNAKTLHDHDVFQAALDDYAYTSYKATTSSVGFEDKYNDLKQFFARTKKEEEDVAE